MPTASDFIPLDVFTADLEGVNLIEASAGTGKTWTITGLYARLILEKNLKVEEILVVTYTKAATAELRGRIRARLVDLWETFKNPDLSELAAAASADLFCRTLLKNYPQGDARNIAIRRLNRAVLSFDEAAVYTIHGFCQRILNDSAFESGEEFDCQLLPDETELLREVVDDFWRREVVPASGLWVDYLANKGQSPDGWLQEIRSHVGKPFLQPLPIRSAEDYFALQQTLEKAYGESRALWQGAGEAVQKCLLAADGLNARTYKKDSLPQWFTELDVYFTPETPGFKVPGCLARLTATALAKGCNKGKTAPAHPFFDFLQTFSEGLTALEKNFEKRLSAMKIDLLHFCNRQLPERKRRRQLLSYQDLLNRLEQALESEQGEHLAQTMRSRFRAALIDEFQDTDPVQYAIFDRVYGGRDLPVFFVGDPKQAIYAFRGADIYSYLKAHGAAKRRYTLDTNQRSIPALIDAVNALFSARADPFLVKSIGYLPVKPAPREHTHLAVKGDSAEPMRFMMLPPKDGKALNKSQANQMAVAAVADEIVRLLELAATANANVTGAGDARPINGGDIAVLTYTHRQAQLIQKALTARDVPSVRQGQDNVFASAEAGELARVLGAVAEPGREGMVKAALTTELMGIQAGEIARLQMDDEAWERQLERFQHYRELWQEKGFMAMLRRWLGDHDVARRLLEYRDGERRLTNLLHLAERLQVESRDKGSCETLLSWYSRTLRDPAAGDEEALLRLESDAERVKIVTIHTSKGLEYPVVFCPFLWDGALRIKNEYAVEFHDPANQSQACLDFGTDEQEQHNRLAAGEKLAEKLRLLYVALTRAKHRCYIVWGEVKYGGNAMESAALSWLLHGPRDVSDNPLEALQQALKGLDARAIAARIAEFAKQVPGAILMEAIDSEAPPAHYRPKQAKSETLARLSFRRGELQPNWRMTSFSAMAAGRHSEAPDYDALDAAEQETPAGDTIFTFPRGANTGSCLHAIFEEWPFDCDDAAALKQLVSRKLKAYAIADRWVDVITAMVRTTLQTPLERDGFSLSCLGQTQKLVELEFTFPLNGLTLSRLQELLRQPGFGVDPAFADACGQLRFDRIEGFMKGFIDLVFEANGRYCLLDYKSNWLGDRKEHYDPSRITRAMARHHYYLQYLIYSLALHRYLKSRLADYDYEHHFGGVYYLFLRGIDPASMDSGVFHDRPAAALIYALDRLINGVETIP